MYLLAQSAVGLATRRAELAGGFRWTDTNVAHEGMDSETIRVLHVDDEPGYAATAGAFLEEEDRRFSVETATSVDEGLTTLEGDAFDCVVSDYEMPGTNGIEFLETVRRRDPELPFVLFTGKGSESIAGEAIRAGVTDYLQKGGTEAYTILANRVANAVEARQSAERADRRQHQLEQIMKTVPGCVVQLSEDGRFVYANERAEEVLGLRSEEVTDRWYNDPEWQIRSLDGTPVPDEELAFQQVRRARAPVFGIRHSIQWPDGTRKALLMNGAPVFEEDGTLDSVVFSLIDITDRLARERTLAALHDVAADLSACESVEAVCERTIEASRELLAFDVSEVSTVSDGMLQTAASTGDSVWEPTQADAGIAGEVYQTGESSVIEDLRAVETAIPAGPYRSALTVPIGDTGVFQALSEEVGAFDEEDRELAELLVSHTVNALQRLERERTLERQNDRLEEFTSVVSHDLRTPLTVAAGNLELARRETDSPHLEEVEAALERSEQLIDDLLMLAREGHRAVSYEPVHVPTVVEGCWATLETGAASLRVETERTIRADARKFRQLLENLLGNAIEHGGAEVTVRIEETEEGLVVVDDGPGIPPDQREWVFEPGHSTADDGTGFGLTVVKQITDAHDWTVRLADTDGGGTRICIDGIDWVE